MRRVLPAQLGRDADRDRRPGISVRWLVRRLHRSARLRTAAVGRPRCRRPLLARTPPRRRTSRGRRRRPRRLDPTGHRLRGRLREPLRRRHPAHARGDAEPRVAVHRLDGTLQRIRRMHRLGRNLVGGVGQLRQRVLAPRRRPIHDGLDAQRTRARRERRAATDHRFQQRILVEDHGGHASRVALRDGYQPIGQQRLRNLSCRDDRLGGRGDLHQPLIGLRKPRALLRRRPRLALVPRPELLRLSLTHGSRVGVRRPRGNDDRVLQRAHLQLRRRLFRRHDPRRVRLALRSGGPNAAGRDAPSKRVRPVRHARQRRRVDTGLVRRRPLHDVTNRDRPDRPNARCLSYRPRWFLRELPAAMSLGCPRRVLPLWSPRYGRPTSRAHRLHPSSAGRFYDGLTDDRAWARLRRVTRARSRHHTAAARATDRDHASGVAGGHGHCAVGFQRLRTVVPRGVRVVG